MSDSKSTIDSADPVRMDLGMAAKAEPFIPLSSLLETAPLSISVFLKLALAMAEELAQLHAAGQIHGNLTPLEFKAAPHAGQAQLSWEHSLPTSGHVPPESPLTQQNLPYLAPERIARWNQKTDSRSDLYSLGVIFYQMLTGTLPFAATDELGWFHSHLARPPAFSESWNLRLSPLVRRIILKLLAKDLGDRYQTASGLMFDLKYCLTHRDENGVDFYLGRQDIPHRLDIPQKIYGRQAEKQKLRQLFEKAARQGTSEIVLISGYAGVGKTALVHELYETVTRRNGFFITGKFDQLNRGIPYYTHIQALQGLIAQILGESEDRVALWRGRLLRALGQQAQVMINVIPSLEIIIGKQPPVPDLPPQETQNRFHNVFQNLVSVFAAPSHPLLVFLDDLHWADTASLKLMEHLASSPILHHVMFIGAYRNQEVDEAHPLQETLHVFRRKQSRLYECELNPLHSQEIRKFLADTLSVSEEEVAPLASLLHQKTAGNPFFLIQYLQALTAEKLIVMDPQSLGWTWDLQAIQSRSYTENVAEFMLARLRKLPSTLQRILELAACLGHEGKIQDLQRLLGEEDLSSKLDPVLLDGILQIHQDSYHFLHDRVQQAAYELLSPDDQKHWHLLIARQIGDGGKSDDEHLFDRISHYMAATDFLKDASERLAVARLSLAGAVKAKTSAANKTALDACTFGLSLLPENIWKEDYALSLELHFMQAECTWRTGDSAAAEHHFKGLLHKAAVNDLDRLRIYRILIEVNTTQGKMQEALIQCQRGLAVLGKDFPVEPTDADVQEVYRAFRESLGSRPIASLIDLPPISDLMEKAALDIMAAAIPAAIFTSLNMGGYLYCKMVCCSLANGNSEASASAYAYFAMILGSVFGEYEEAFQLGKLGHDMAQRDAHAWKSRIFVIFGNVVNHWTRPMRSNIPYLRAALPAAQEVGDLAGACYCCNHLISTQLALGDPLPDVYAEIARSLQFVQTMNYPSIADIIISQQRLVMALQGKTRRYSGLSSDHFDEDAFAKRIASSQMSLLKFWYHTRQLQTAYLLERLDEALQAGEAAQALSWSSPGHVEEAEFHFYQALTLAKACTRAQRSERDVWLQQLITIRDRFALWASHAAENFAHKHHLIAAEVSRLKGEDLAAMRAYENAIVLARQNHFIQDEALSHELAACYYENAGFQNFADQYHREARRCYQEWGAIGKVLLLNSRYPQLIPTADLNDYTARMVDIDMVSLMRATQNISSEIVPARLSETLMRLLVEASGAERGFLLLARQGNIYLEASAHTSADALTVEVLHSVLLQNFAELPHTIMNFVQRSQQKVVLADAREPHAFSHDEYLREQKPRSLLCVPIVKNRKLVGLIYLENRQIGGTFTADKLTALEILASQAAISIENARLYADLGREEEKLRGTIESMADGLIVTDTHARITLINEAALKMVGLSSNQDIILHNREQMAKRLEYRDAADNIVPFDQLPLSRALHGDSTHQVEYHIRHLISGRVIIIRLSASPLRNHAGQIQGAVVVFRDVTELTELDRLKDEFLRAMAHELKTPLLVVGGYFEMFKILQKQGAPAATLQECMGRIETGISRLKSLMATLVDVAVFQLRKLKLNLEELDLQALSRTLMDEIASTAPKHQFRFASTHHGPLMIQGDRARLIQLIMQFLQNAIKYSPHGGTITLDMEDEDETVVVHVKDQGIGIPRDRQERLFQRFYRAHAETEHDYGGMGVGLFLAQEIVLAHRGKIWFSSEPGAGSSFSFRLPKRPAVPSP